MPCCVDDILAIGIDQEAVPEGLRGRTVRSKNGKIKIPERHLGDGLQRKTVDGIQRWAVTSEECVEAAASAIGTLILRDA